MKPTQCETTVSPGAPPPASTTRPLFLVAAGLILISGVLVAMALYHLRGEAIQSGERLTASFAHVIEEQTERSIQLIDERLQTAVTGLGQLDAAGQLSEQTSRTLLKKQLKDLPFVRAFWVLNAEGRSKFDSDAGNTGLNYADRDYFQIYLTQPQTKFYVGRPVRSATTGAWLISVARPLQSAGGKFAGVVVAALEPRFFQSLWQQADLGDGSAIALWRRDGVLMMRSPTSDARMGEDFAAYSLFRKWLPGGPVGAFHDISPFEGDFRSFAYRTLSTQPDLIVVVSRSLEVMLKPWWEFAKLTLTIWAVKSAMLLVFCVLLNRMWKQRALTEAATREIAQRLALATDVASIGISDWDVNSGIFFATPICFTMLGDDPGDGRRSGEQWLERIHPEDRHIAGETIRDLLAGLACDYANEVRMRHADGSFRWVSGAGRVLAHNADGTASRILGVRIDITERKHAEIALQKAEERYRVLVEWAPEPVCVHRHGKMLYVNPATVKWLAAKSADELVGRSILDVVHPDSRHVVLSRLKDLADGDTNDTLYELKFAKLDGTVVDVEIRGTTILYAGAPATYVVMRDITALKEEEDALRKSEVALAEAQRVAQIGSWSWHAATDTVEWSDELFKILALELSSPALNFENQLKLFTVESAAHLTAAAQRAMQTGEPYDLELERKCDDGERRWVAVRGEARRSASGRIFGLRGTVQNITERKLADAMRASLEEQLRESQKMQAIGTLAGGIAHDFNNILATILGNTALARADLHDNASALQSLDEISKAGARARDLVQQILSFSRREPMQRKLTALAPVVDESVRLLRAAMPPRITLDVHCAADLQPVSADANQIQQIVINLVTNALQAMRDKPGHIAVRLGLVLLDEALTAMHPILHTMGVAQGTSLVRLTVIDDGPGMDAKTVARIFEPFFTTKPVDEGTGLGLSVVHGIVHAHDGAILVDSLPGKGATFTIYFPVTETPAIAHGSRHDAEAHSALAATPAHGSQHILYIDDDEALVFLVQRTLERRGYRVSGFTDQREALAALRSDPAAFDLVVTDYNMPGMSGLDVARAVRAIRLDLPLAVASGFIDEKLLAEAEGAGVRELIFKANAVEDLCDAFVRVMHKVGKAATADAPVGVIG